MSHPDPRPPAADGEREDPRAWLIETLQSRIYADATGLTPAVIGHHLFGFEQAADAILSRLTAAEAGREEAEKERDAWKAQVESWQATAQDEAEIGNERRSEADAVRARVEKLERALRGLVFYAGQLEALVYDPTDTGEKDVMVEARAALTEAQPKGDQ